MPLNRLGLAWQIDDYSPMGIIGLHLFLSLIKQGKMQPLLYTQPRLVSPSPGTYESLRPYVEEMTLMLGEVEVANKSVSLKDALTLHDLHDDLAWRDVSMRITGHKNVGMTFFRGSPNTKPARARASLLDRVVVRSKWQETVLNDMDISNVVYWRPGYDDWLFYPREKDELHQDRFVIYSAGHMHLANGQDIVLAAFKAFRESHPDALLITSWQTPYHDQLELMSSTPHQLSNITTTDNLTIEVVKWAVGNGIEEKSIIDTGIIGNQSRPSAIANADVALFPNRGTSGPDMCAIETMAMGIPTILSQNTGHLDLIEDGNCLTLKHQGEIQSDGINTSMWGETSVDEIVAHLEWVYENREAAREVGQKGLQSNKPYTWFNQTQDLMDKLSDLINVQS